MASTEKGKLRLNWTDGNQQYIAPTCQSVHSPLLYGYIRSVKRTIGISIFLGLFALVFGHMLIPHHHHDAEILVVGLVQTHEADGDHSEHHHHTLDPFFSLISFFNDVEHFDFSADAVDLPFLGMMLMAFSELGLSDEEGSVGNAPPSLILLLSEGLIESHGLRGPPLM